jgi:hypothetical protein
MAMFYRVLASVQEPLQALSPLNLRADRPFRFVKTTGAEIENSDLYEELRKILDRIAETATLVRRARGASQKAQPDADELRRPGKHIQA